MNTERDSRDGAPANGDAPEPLVDLGERSVLGGAPLVGGASLAGGGAFDTIGGGDLGGPGARDPGDSAGDLRSEQPLSDTLPDPDMSREDARRLAAQVFGSEEAAAGDPKGRGGES